jgi:hypothetical protein
VRASVISPYPADRDRGCFVTADPPRDHAPGRFPVITRQR